MGVAGPQEERAARNASKARIQDMMAVASARLGRTHHTQSMLMAPCHNLAGTAVAGMEAGKAVVSRVGGVKKAAEAEVKERVGDEAHPEAVLEVVAVKAKAAMESEVKARAERVARARAVVRVAMVAMGCSA